MMKTSVKTSSASSTTTTSSSSSSSTSIVAIVAARPSLTSPPASFALPCLTLGSKEPVDSLHAGPEILELVEEKAECGVDHFILLCLPSCNFSHLFLHEGPDVWLTEFPVEFLEAAEECEPEASWHHVPAHGPLLLLLLVRSLLRRPLVHLDHLTP